MSKTTPCQGPGSVIDGRIEVDGMGPIVSAIPPGRRGTP